MDVVIYFIENEILNNFTTILMYRYTNFPAVFSFYIIFYFFLHKIIFTKYIFDKDYIKINLHKYSIFPINFINN